MKTNRFSELEFASAGASLQMEAAERLMTSQEAYLRLAALEYYKEDTTNTRVRLLKAAREWSIAYVECISKLSEDRNRDD